MLLTLGRKLPTGRQFLSNNRIENVLASGTEKPITHGSEPSVGICFFSGIFISFKEKIEI